MKKMVFLVTTVWMFLALSVSAQQQQQRGQREKMTPEQQATRTVERLNKDLTLNDKQKADLKKWYTDSYTQRAKSMEKNKDNREAMRESMKKERTATEAQMKKVLTADQFKKYQENEKKRQQNMQNRGGQRGQGGGARGIRPGQGQSQGQGGGEIRNGQQGGRQPW